ncbi:MAG: NADH-quinone oxidoreductase subunit N [Armatimonadota bacterium]|nr:NADH-quinone oxidoreductase subunit N [Armatimonadota bacterium]
MGAFVAPQIDWGAVAPIGIVVATAVATLIVELFLPRTQRALLVAIGLLGVALATYFQFAIWQARTSTFGEMVVADTLGALLSLAVLGATALTLLFAEDYLQARGLRYGEFYPLLLFASAGAIAMLTTTNLMVVFIGLETLSLALYVLAGLSRTEPRSEESALKYFLLGAFASAFLLYGIALMYGALGSVDLRAVPPVWETAQGGALPALLTVSLVLLLIGLAFKASLVPFHLWTPDVYQGAPTIATAYMSAVAKVAAFGVLIRLMVSFAPASLLWMPTLWWLSLLSMVVGNVAALLQRDAKRMLAYSSVAHAGYLAVGLVSANSTGTTGMIYYLVAYSLMSVGAFGILTLMAHAGDATTVEALRGLYRRNPFAAHALAVLLLSLAGIPPTAGFWGKWYLFLAAVEANQIVLALVLALTSVVGAAYYLQLVFSLYAEPREAVVSWRIPAPMVIGVLACVLGLIGLGIFPTSLTRAAQYATRQIQVEQPREASPNDASLATQPTRSVL